MGKKIKIKGVFAYIHEHQRGMDLSGTFEFATSWT
jgi:hypothetical protein